MSCDPTVYNTKEKEMKEDDVKETAITALRQKLAEIEDENHLLERAIVANNELILSLIKRRNNSGKS